MMKRGMVLAWSVLAFGCVAEETLPSPEAQEIAENLEQAGFPANDITIVDDKVYVERDAEMSLATSREALGPGGSCSGSTKPDATAWQQFASQALYVDVDTSACGYTAAPLYFASLGGNGRHWRTTGATSIYLPTATGFRIHLFDENGPVTPADANARGWHINWRATPNNLRLPEECTSNTRPGATAWQQAGAQTVYVDVNTSACGYTTVPRYFTSLGGSVYHKKTTGGTSISVPTAIGFRVYVYYPAPITPGDANAYGWYINWQATSRNLRLPEVCTGGTLSGVTGWQQFGTQGLYLDVYTSPCGYTTAPLYFTSLVGNGGQWKTTGATSIYSPTATGFRVYLFRIDAPITPADANASGWYINWQARFY